MFLTHKFVLNETRVILFFGCYQLGFLGHELNRILFAKVPTSYIHNNNNTVKEN